MTDGMAVNGYVEFHSSSVKVVPLSVTTTSGRPSDANDLLENSVVAADVAVLVTCISIHFENASTISINIFPSNGPA